MVVSIVITRQDNVLVSQMFTFERVPNAKLAFLTFQIQLKQIVSNATVILVEAPKKYVKRFKVSETYTV